MKNVFTLVAIALFSFGVSAQETKPAKKETAKKEACCAKKDAKKCTAEKKEAKACCSKKA